ncbi:hypothetical protein RCH08_000871 [Janthinobacterium sp. CG_S6]|nr:hypothetical protein [Janthinobacterium sp. CG_S6]
MARMISLETIGKCDVITGCFIGEMLKIRDRIKRRPGPIEHPSDTAEVDCGGGRPPAQGGEKKGPPERRTAHRERHNPGVDARTGAPPAKRFGAKAEALSSEQRDLFQETWEADLAELEARVDAPRKKRARAGRQPLPGHIERVARLHESDSCTCGRCGGDLVKIGELHCHAARRAGATADQHAQTALQLGCFDQSPPGRHSRYGQSRRRGERHSAGLQRNLRGIDRHVVCIGATTG